MVGVDLSARFRILRRWRLWLVSGSTLVVLMALFQNCGRMRTSVPSPTQIYTPQILQMLADLPESQKTSLCQSAANYQCQRLRIGSHLLDRDLAEMVCLKHEAFPKRVCIQTQYYDRAGVDTSIACQGCAGLASAEVGSAGVGSAGVGSARLGSEGLGSEKSSGDASLAPKVRASASAGSNSAGSEELAEYSCFNSALKVRTLVEHRLFASTLEDALAQTYFACRASLEVLKSATEP